MLNRLLFQFQGGGADEDQFPQLVVHFHYFVQTSTAFVATLVAGVAALPVINLRRLDFIGGIPSVDERLLGQFQFFFAIRTDAAHEALCADKVHRGSDEERLNTHVHQAADGGRSVVGVQCRQNQVTRERGFDRNFGRFKVTDFAD